MTPENLLRLVNLTVPRRPDRGAAMNWRGSAESYLER